jgi:hypothetical protein
MKSLKRFVSTITVASLLASATLAQDAAVSEKTSDKKTEKVKSVDPSGTWRWESDRNGDTVKHQLKLDVNKKEEVTGTYFGMMDGLKSKKGVIKGDKLVLEFDVERDNFAFQAKYEATIKGDKATGTLYFESDQGSGDIPWEAERSVELSDVVGTWELELETPEGEIHEPSLTIKDKGKEFVATWDGKELGEFPVKDLKANAGKFSFTLTGDIDGNDFVAKCVTKPMGSKFNGVMELEIGGDAIELEFAGTRKTDKKKKKS